MDIWDRKSLKNIATVEAPNSSECSWSPDGRYIMTATLSPRLRVDNGYKIWHYTGDMVHSQNKDELLQVGSFLNEIIKIKKIILITLLNKFIGSMASCKC